MDSRYTHTGIDKQLVKKEWVKTELINRLFEVFNGDETKNGKVTRFVLLELKINKHIERIMLQLKPYVLNVVIS